MKDVVVINKEPVLLLLLSSFSLREKMEELDAAVRMKLYYKF